MLRAHIFALMKFLLLFLIVCAKSSGLGLFRPFGKGIDLQTIFKLLPLWHLAEPDIFPPRPKPQLFSVRKQFNKNTKNAHKSHLKCDKMFTCRLNNQVQHGYANIVKICFLGYRSPKVFSDAGLSLSVRRLYSR